MNNHFVPEFLTSNLVADRAISFVSIAVMPIVKDVNRQKIIIT